MAGQRWQRFRALPVATQAGAWIGTGIVALAVIGAVAPQPSKTPTSPASTVVVSETVGSSTPTPVVTAAPVASIVVTVAPTVVPSSAPTPQVTTAPAPTVHKVTATHVPATRTPVPRTPTPAPAAVSCHPLSNSGHCYTAGQFCRDVDHGVTGIAGNGATIVCEDKNGWRWIAH